MFKNSSLFWLKNSLRILVFLALTGFFMVIFMGGFSVFFEAHSQTFQPSLKSPTLKELAGGAVPPPASSASSASAPSSSGKDLFEPTQIFHLKDVEEIIRPDLDQHISEDYKIDFGAHPFPLDVFSPTPVQLRLHDLSVNDRKTRFTVKVSFQGLDVKPFQISGGLVLLTRVPALNRQITPDETIKAEDITWVSVPTRSINRATLTDPEQIKGAQPRNGVLRPDIPLKINDIKRPKVIKRGDMVTLGIHTQLMTIETSAQALDDGDVGSFIRVSNLSSRQVVQAKVLREKYVSALYTQESSQ